MTSAATKTLLQALSGWAGLGPREGAEPSGADRGAWLLVGGVLALYLATCAIAYPSVVTVVDETIYLREARLLPTWEGGYRMTHPLTGESVLIESEIRYPLGTSIVMAPFVALAGWRGAYAVPLLSIAVGVLFTGLWLRQAGRSPFFALVVLGYPPALVLGRLALSDAPSLAICAAGLWCFWRGRDAGPGWWLASGLLAGTSFLFRESNVLIFAPLFAGALLRREARVFALVAGGVAGLSLRAAVAALLYGDALFYKEPDPFQLEAVLRTTPVYLVALLVFVPGGLLAGLAYRGERRSEIVATVLLVTGFYCLYSYSGARSGLAKQLVLGPRFFLPLLPVLAFCLAEVAPRVFASLSPRARRAARAALAAWVAAVALAAIAIPVGLDRWSAGQAEIREELERLVPGDKILVTNAEATSKFIELIDREQPALKHRTIGPVEVAALLHRHGEFYLAILSRSDSAYWRREAAKDEAYLEMLGSRSTLIADRQITPTDRLRIWRFTR